MKTWVQLEGTRVVCAATNQDSMPAPWVEATAAVPIDRAPAPHMRLHVVDWQTMQVGWIDSRTPAQAKAQRTAAMRDARDAVLNGTFTWDGSTFDADQVSQTRLLGAVVAALEPGFDPTLWRLANNEWRELTGTQLRAVYQALQLHVRACFTQFGQREAAINAATTVAAVDAVTWE